MKKSIASRIEQYIKVLIARSENGQIEIQRRELAETFACAPSQVSYVLGTRFSLKDGYLIESRRGGQGYVRIIEIKSEGGLFDNALLMQFIEEMRNKKLLNEREKEMLKHIVLNVAVNLPAEYRIRVNQAIATALRDFLNSGAGI